MQAKLNVSVLGMTSNGHRTLASSHLDAGIMLHLAVIRWLYRQSFLVLLSGTAFRHCFVALLSALGSSPRSHHPITSPPQPSHTVCFVARLNASHLL